VRYKKHIELEQELVKIKKTARLLK
jgi:hypothetical protein